MEQNRQERFANMDDATKQRIAAMSALIEMAVRTDIKFAKTLKYKLKTLKKAPPYGWYIAQLEKVFGTQYVRQFLDQQVG